MPDQPFLLFDVMNTLVTEPYYEAVPAFLGMNLDDLYREKDHEAFLAFERGQIDEDEYARRFFTDRRSLDTTGLKRTLQNAYQFMDGIQVLLQELHGAGYAMHAFSNYSPWYILIEQKLALSRYMSWDFVSCRTGFRKPEAEAYQFAIDRLGVAPETCLLIDDREKNVAGARQAGMQAILRPDHIDALREKLREYGVTVEISSASP